MPLVGCAVFPENNVSMDQNEPFPPVYTPPPSAPKKKKSFNPLFLVLGISAFFFAAFIAVSILVFSMTQKSAEFADQKTGALFSSGDGVAILEVRGVILDSKRVLQRLKTLGESKEVKAVVVRLDSPGGAVAPSQEIYEAIKAFPKPVVASMGSVAASGAYYIAMGTKRVFANKGTLTGSIGVIMEFANIKELLKWAKIDQFSIKTGKFKDTGAANRDMTVEERELLQVLVDDVLQQFRDAVEAGRKLTKDQVIAASDGRIFTGVQAKKLGLVDELGTLQDAVNEAAKLAGIKGTPRVLYPAKPRAKLLDLLMDSGAAEDEAQSSSRFSRAFGAFFGLSASAEDFWGAPGQSLLLPSGVYWLWNGTH
jgi:protease-4